MINPIFYDNFWSGIWVICYIKESPIPHTEKSIACLFHKTFSSLTMTSPKKKKQNTKELRFHLYCWFCLYYMAVKHLTAEKVPACYTFCRNCGSAFILKTEQKKCKHRVVENYYYYSDDHFSIPCKILCMEQNQIQRISPNKPGKKGIHMAQRSIERLLNARLQGSRYVYPLREALN